MIRPFASALLLLVLASNASASLVTNFEDQGLSANSYVNNAGSSGQFVSGGNAFNNSYDPTYGVWSGWAMSTKTDGTTNSTFPNPDYTYQYSSVTGAGAGGSATYAVAYTFGNVTDPAHPDSSVINLASGQKPVSVDVTNTAYLYHAIKYGDQFSTPFQNGDYFELTITGYNGTNGTGSVVGEVDSFLADYRNGQQFVLDVWKTLSLTSLAGSQSLRFGLRSTDNSPLYGMNTPAYFAIDNVVTSAPEPASAWLGLVGLAMVAVARRMNRIHALIRGREGRDA